MSPKAKTTKIDPATCSHPLISRHIDPAKGGFSGTWVCQRCKQEFTSLKPLEAENAAPDCINYTASVPVAEAWRWTPT